MFPHHRSMGIHLKASKSNTRPPGIMIWGSLLIDLEKYDMEFAISRMDFCVYLFSGYIQPHLVFDLDTNRFRRYSVTSTETKRMNSGGAKGHLRRKVVIRHGKSPYRKVKRFSIRRRNSGVNGRSVSRSERMNECKRNHRWG